MLIVVANSSLAGYPLGGGVWSWMLQYPLGLRALGHDVFWIESMESCGDPARDREFANDFFTRIAAYGLAPQSALLVFEDLDVQDIDRAQVYGPPLQAILDIAHGADLLWNLACSIRQPLLAKFARRVLIDVDPGHLQISAMQFEMGVSDHQVHLSVGAKLHDPDCGAPTLGLTWRPFLPFVYLPMWEAAPDPGPEAPFSSITQWTWEEISYHGRTLSLSKRAAYLRYVDLPALTGRAFELAAFIGDKDPAHDRASLRNGGWRIVDPHKVANTPEAYQGYLRASRAEISCPKPIFRELNTGWFSDRSVSYMALGRPVVAEDTGFGDVVPTGRGVLKFRDSEEAQAAVAEIDRDYRLHSRRARELACDLFNSDRQLKVMLAAC
jgi:hypothetical protein